MNDSQGFQGLREALAASRALRIDTISEAVEDVLMSLEADERREIMLRVARQIWGVQLALPEVDHG